MEKARTKRYVYMSYIYSSLIVNWCGIDTNLTLNYGLNYGMHYELNYGH